MRTATRQTLRKHCSDWLKSTHLARRPFYRLCRYRRSSHPLYRHNQVMVADERTLVSHAGHYVFVRVPKCANTTILGTLAQAELGAGSRPEAVTKKRVLAQQFDRPSRLSRQLAREVFDSYRLCIFVRNPFTRVASAYLHKIRAGGYTQRAGLPADLSFRGFCEHLAAGGLYRDVHWVPQIDLCPVVPERLDFVGRFESLEPDLERLLDVLYGTRCPTITRDHHATGADDRARALYCDVTRRLIADLYARDFAAFGYDPERIPG